jgi:hypothetical protein
MNEIEVFLKSWKQKKLTEKEVKSFKRNNDNYQLTIKLKVFVLGTNHKWEINGKGNTSPDLESVENLAASLDEEFEKRYTNSFVERGL